MGGALCPPPPCNFGVSQGRMTKFASIGYFNVPSSKMALISYSGLLCCHYDVIIGNMKGFVTLLFIKVEGQNLADWGILMCTFQKTIYF